MPSPLPSGNSSRLRSALIRLRPTDRPDDLPPPDGPTIAANRLRLAGDPTPVDQDLCVLGADAPQRRRSVFADIVGENDAWHPLHHVADGNRLEALEELLVVREGRRGRVDTVARIDALREHDDLVELRAVCRRSLSEHRAG